MRYELPELHEPMWKPAYRGYIAGNVHVRACFFLGRCGTSTTSADEAQRNIGRLTDYGSPLVHVDAATTGEMWS